MGKVSKSKPSKQRRAHPKKPVAFPPRSAYSDEPIVHRGEFNLVASRVNAFPLVDWSDPDKQIVRKYTINQKRLADNGFHPGWWLPADVATEWKGYIYPLNESAESVAQFRRMSELLADSAYTIQATANQGETARRTVLAELEHNLAILRRHNPAIVPGDSAHTDASDHGEQPKKDEPLYCNIPDGFTGEISKAVTATELSRAFGAGKNGIVKMLKNGTILARQIRHRLWVVAIESIPTAYRARFRDSKAAG